MTQKPEPMRVGRIFLIIILTGVVIGALMGIARAEFGGSALITGGATGFVVGALAAVLFRRRARALRSQAGC
jgi:membrane associated rhomboid family serine protease